MSFWSDIGSGKFGAALSDLDPFKRGNIFGSSRNPPQVAPPPVMPDLTDQLLRYAQRAELLRANTGTTRQSTFGLGPAGLVGPRLGTLGTLPGIGGGF